MLQREESRRKKLQQLQQEGYHNAYGIEGGKIVNPSSQETMEPSHFRVVKDFRFEGLTSLSHASILLALEHERTGEKGTLIAPNDPMASQETKQVLLHLTT